jgi:hypothetical protein
LAELTLFLGLIKVHKTVFSLGSISRTFRTGTIGFRVQNYTGAVIAGGAGIKTGAAFCIAFREIVELFDPESKKRKMDSGSSPE